MSKRKRRIIAFAALLGLYLISYAGLSYCGGYRLVMFGRPNPPGLGISDFVWQPRFGVCYQWGTGYHLDGLGLLFFPLIYVDQKLVHLSRPYLTFVGDDIDQGRFHAWPPTEQMHPIARHMIAAADTVRARHQSELDAARKHKDFTELSLIKSQMQHEVQLEIGDPQ